MDSIELNLDSGNRSVFLEEHNFYHEQLKKRIFSQFKNMENEIQKVYNEECNRLSKDLTCDSDFDSIGDLAEDNAINYAVLSWKIEHNIYLSGLAGLYFQWEKNLRSFIESELKYTNLTTKEIKNIWNISIYEIFNVLKIYDWDTKLETFYENLNACRLIVNVYRHGDGVSFNELKTKYRKYLKNAFLDSTDGNEDSGIDFLWHENLRIDEQEFDELVEAIKQFWEAFPEKNIIPSQDKLDKLLAMLKNKKKPSAKQVSKG